MSRQTEKGEAMINRSNVRPRATQGWQWLAIGVCLFGRVAAADGVVEGPLKPFLTEPRLEMHQVFRGERFPNVVVTLKGTVLVTWGTKSVRVRRSEDGGVSWGEEDVVERQCRGNGGRRSFSDCAVGIYTHEFTYGFRFRLRDTF